MSLAVETYRDPTAIDRLRDEWETLATASAERAPFLSYDWFRCCLEDAEGTEPFVLAVRDGGRLLGIAPFRRETIHIRRQRAKAIGFIRCRETPHADLIVDRARRGEALDAILEHLRVAERASWDVLLLTPWPETSANYVHVRERAAALGLRTIVRQASLVPVVPIEAPWEEFWSGRSYLFRKSRRGVLKRMQRVGTVEVECHRSDPGGDVLRAVFAISDRSWKRAEGKAVTSREESKRFFQALTDVAGTRGWLRIWILRIDGTPVAMEYDLAEDGIVHALRADFDEAHARHSPGAYLEYHLLQRLFEEGHRAYHAGPGSDAYKLRWTEDQRRNVTLVVFNRSSRGSFLWLLEGIVAPRLKRIRDGLARRRPGNPA